MNLLKKSITKTLSLLLSFIMIFSLFTIVPVSVTAADGLYTLTVEVFEPSILNDHYENIAIETKINGSTADGSSHSLLAGSHISVTARLINNDYRFHVTGMTMTYMEDGETKTLESELDILDVYRNVKADFLMPSADARISFTVEEVYSVRVNSSADGILSADCIRARKGDTVDVTVNPTNPAKPYYKLYAEYEWDTTTRYAEINNNHSFIMPAGADVTVYAEFFDAVATYIERWWDGEKVVSKECIRTPNEGFILMSTVPNGSTLQDGNWYYVNSNVTFSSRIHTDGEVNIILGDGATVDFKRGLEVSEGDTLNVYDQKQGTGKMIAFCERFAQRDDQDEAAIGGDTKNDGGNMNFYGGNFEVTTKTETRGAAIGGAGFRAGGRMIFYGGKYTIDVKYGNSTGIGGGYKGQLYRETGEGTTIYGGTFDISTYLSGACIGSGIDANRSTGAIAIYGGDITAKGRSGCAAIGGGKGSENGPIYIYGGNVNAIAYGDRPGAGIGAGRDAEQGGPIYISGGSVFAQSIDGAGIGGGMGKGGGYVDISGGFVVATSASGAGIGGGKNGSNHIVNITGGYVISTSSSYDSSSDMLERVTRYLGHAPMGSQYQRTANAMMITVAALTDLFSGSEELSGAGIGGGHGGSGGEVNIYGGIVIAKSGLSSANAIGKGKGGSNSGTLDLGHDMMVSSGSDDLNATLQTKDNRVSVCRNSKFVEVRPCGFTHTNYTIVDEYCHKTTCEYCAVDQDLNPHEYDASDLTCTLCGYQRIKVSFDPGDGSGTMEDVYLTKGETYTLPASDFTPPNNKYFSGWRGMIGSTTDVFAPGASFTLNDSVTLTADYGDTYQLWVGGVQVNDANMNDILGDGKVSFDPDTSNLHLSGVTSFPGVNSDQQSLIYAKKMNLTVTGSGSLTVGQMFMNGVWVDNGSLTLDGDFSVSGSQGNGFYASKDIIISGGAITAQARNYGIRSGRRIYLYDGITRVSIDAELQKSLYYDDIFVDPSLLVTEYSPEDALRPNGSFYYNYTNHIIIERGAVITYVLNGGTMDGQTDEVEKVVPISTTVESPEPVFDGYTFDGWYTDDQYSAPFDFNNPVNGDITLFAKWTEKPRYTISMSDMAGGYVFAPAEAYEGQKVRVYPHDEFGYNLEYFSYTTDGGVETEIIGVDDAYSITMPADNITINAVFRGGTYQINIADSVPAGALSAPASARAGEKVSVTVNEIEGQHLVDVAVKDAEDHNVRYDDENNIFTMPLSDVTISAAYEAHVYEEPEWTWDGHDSATAVFHCTICGYDHAITAQGEDITYVTTIEPTYTSEGERVYTASVTFGGVTYTSDKTETLEKLSRNVTVTYIDLNGNEKTVTATRIVGDETDLESGWYAVVDSVTNNNRISNNGQRHGGVNLILCDGATLTNPLGMSVNGGRFLTVWGQSEGTGTWNITSPPQSCAGIGGYNTVSGNITINGGTVNATGAQNAAGIGAGAYAPYSSGVITINGGTVNAKGGHSAAGIGGGNANNNYAGRIVINGGNVTATGNTHGAGIGSGRQSYCDVVISGGTVKAVEGSLASAGIGGSGSTVTLTYTDDVSITSDSYGGTVTLEKPFTDGTNVFEAGVVSDNSTLNNTTLTPYVKVFVYHSLTLNGDIGVNFYLKLTEEELAENPTVSFTLNGEVLSTYTIDAQRDAKVIDGTTLYKATCWVCAPEMTDTITATLSIDGNAVATDTYSVKAYADVILSDDYRTKFLEKEGNTEEDYNELAALAAAMLNYGGAAQVQFADEHPNDDCGMANEGLDAPAALTSAELSAIDMPKPDKDAINAQLDGTGLTYYGYTMLLHTKTSLRFYFVKENPDTDISGIHLSIGTGDDTVTFNAQNYNDRYAYVEVKGIPAYELNNAYTLSVNGEDLGSYSALTYIKDVLTDEISEETSVNTVTAMYRYHEAAFTYFNNHHN